MVAKQQRMNAGASSQMAKPNKSASKAVKSIYPSAAWLAEKWAKKIASSVKNAVKRGSSASAKWNKMTAKHTSRSFPKAEPYYDYRTKSTKWGTDVRIGELPRKAKRK